MEIVEKGATYFMGSVERCAELFEEDEELLCYPAVTHVWHHKESSYLAVMDLYNQKYQKIANEIKGETPPGLGKLQSI